MYSAHLYGKKFDRLLDKIFHIRYIVLSIVFGFISLVSLVFLILSIIALVNVGLSQWKPFVIWLVFFISVLTPMIVFIVLRVYQNRDFKAVARRSERIASYYGEDGKTVYLKFYKLRKNKDKANIIALADKYYRLVEKDKNSFIKKNKDNKRSSRKSGLGVNFFQYILFKLSLYLLSIITLGIGYPITFFYMTKWEAEHTYIDRRALRFDGSIKELMLIWLKWLGLVLLTLGVYSFFISKRLKIWKYNHIHIEGELTILGGGVYTNAWVHFFLKLGLKVLLVISLGLAKPYTVTRLANYEVVHTMIDGRRLSFNGNTLNLGGKFILWWFLTIITLGIYNFFLNLEFKKWVDRHTHLKNDYEQVKVI